LIPTYILAKVMIYKKKRSTHMIRGEGERKGAYLDKERRRGCEAGANATNIILH